MELLPLSCGWLWSPLLFREEVWSLPLDDVDSVRSRSLMSTEALSLRLALLTRRSRGDGPTTADSCREDDEGDDDDDEEDDDFSLGLSVGVWPLDQSNAGASPDLRSLVRW